ncbi:MAG: HDIG domain-containing protein [Pseudoflavonifractor sp.]|nr:HDIG domain-containing protein [Alloprevotella sp.]MCM1117571.1 HDIG domain-containing protein [Pseudoflavonifractor sp.]
MNITPRYNPSSSADSSASPVWNSPWLKWVVLAAAVFVIAYCLPRNHASHFDYERDRPWNYGLLTAPFEFAVRPDSAYVNRAKDSINKVFEPIYTRDASADKILLGEVSRRIEESPEVNLSPGERNRLLGAIRRVTEGGIVDNDVYADIRAGRLRTVRMIHNNTAVSIPTTNYLSPKAAYARIDSTLADSRYRSAIAAVHLPEILKPNVVLDTLVNARMLEERYRKAIASPKAYKMGERIIDRGEVVDEPMILALKSYEAEIAERGSLDDSSVVLQAVGRVLYLILLFGALYTFLYFYRRDYFRQARTVAFLMLMSAGFILFALLMNATFDSGLYLTPFTMVAIITLVFLDSRTAFFTFNVTVLGAALVASHQLEFIFIQWVAGVVAINSIRELSKRSELIRTAVLVFVAYILGFVAMEIIQSGTLAHMGIRLPGFFAINSVFISFAYILVFVLEKVFGFTSRVTLVELSDINHPLLRELSEECPGTFQHSMAVSNLATAAANRIGAKVQLVRAGALYHDIGKIANPAFFTENQHGVNPHDALDPLQSAKIVIGHVTEGVRRAEKAKLPKVLRDFIVQHHGRGKARYFYTTYCNAHPNEEVDPAPFTYPGPNPTSREASILMMADAVEAASRSLGDHSPEAIAALVDRIIDSQVAEGLHNNSPISFRDISEIKEVFASRLQTMFHGRIPYPEMNKRPSATASTSSVASPEK